LYVIHIRIENALRTNAHCASHTFIAFRINALRVLNLHLMHSVRPDRPNFEQSKCIAPDARCARCGT